MARELHDSVGHALSLVTIQAAAARRVLASDPEFAETALGAIETSARAALADLDHVLGLLRDDRRPGSGTAPQATLEELDRLVEASRAGGITITVERSGELELLPAAVSGRPIGSSRRGSRTRSGTRVAPTTSSASASQSGWTTPVSD